MTSNKNYLKLYKQISRLKKIRNRIYLRLQVFGLFFLALAYSLIKKGKKISVHEFKAGISEDILINIFGNVDGNEDLNIYDSQINSVKNIVSETNLSFVTIRNNNVEFQNMMNSEGFHNVYNAKECITESLFVSSAGKIGVVSYNRFSKAARGRHIKLDLMRSCLNLKRHGADFVFLYINDRYKKTRQVGQREQKLFEIVSLMGYDYIVGVTPNLRHSGKTYNCSGKTVRSVFSVGTFLTHRKKLSNKRVVVKLVIRNVKGRFIIVQESYIPFLATRDGKFKKLLFEKNELAYVDRKELKFLSQIETEMNRMRPINRMLTLDKLMQVIGAELPENLKYMSDFSVGKVCARSYECAPGDVFFFRQPFNDPNDIVPENVKARVNMARRMSAFSLLVISYKPFPAKKPYLIMKDTIEAHISACAYLRSQFPAKYIGITGSVGKTSVKDLLYEVVSTEYNTFKSKRNSNVQVKIGLDIQKLTSNCDLFIQEIGGGRPGGASRHSRMILPEITVLTNIGDAHIGNFGSREKLMENKLGIAEGMTKNGVMFLNADDPLLSQAKPDCRKVFYSVHNKTADYYAENIREHLSKTYFNVVHNNTRTPVVLNVIGEHNVLNAVCCFAIGKYLNIPDKKIATGLSNFETSGIRQNLNNVCGVKLFMDCYNASSESMKSSMEVLSKIKANSDAKRIAIIGDITGMGELVENVHRDVANTVMNNPADHMIFFGSSIEEAYKTVSSNGYSCFYTSKRSELNKHLEEIVRPGDVIMAKGSSKVLLEYTIDSVFGTRFTDQRLLDEVEFRRVKSDRVSYNVFENYATAVKSDLKARFVRIKKKVAGITVTNCGPNIGHKNLNSVYMPDSIIHISSRCFQDCENLVSIKMSKNIKFISNAAFKNCKSLKSIQLFDGLRHIDESAFEGCVELEELYIPDSVVQINNNAFKDCPKLTIYCKEGSYADSCLNGTNIKKRYI